VSEEQCREQKRLRMPRAMSWNVASKMFGGLAAAPPAMVAGAAIALDSNVARTGIKDGFIVML